MTSCNASSRLDIRVERGEDEMECGDWIEKVGSKGAVRALWPRVASGEGEMEVS